MKVDPLCVCGLNVHTSGRNTGNNFIVEYLIYPAEKDFMLFTQYKN